MDRSSISHQPAQRLRLALLAGCLLSIVGCGPKAPYTIVPTKGSITYEDGTPIPAGVSVRFLPQMPAINAKEHPRPGYAEVDKAGNFTSLTTWKYDDGIIPGPHKVQILDAGGTPLPTEILAPEFSDPIDTPLSIEAKGDGSPIHLKVPKPG